MFKNGLEGHEVVSKFDFWEKGVPGRETVEFDVWGLREEIVQLQ